MRLTRVQILEGLLTLQGKVYHEANNAPSTMDLAGLVEIYREMGDMIGKLELDFWDEGGDE